ncbi:leucine-rich repeat domain-containing protein [Neochlamydia sp. S13]|uniref:F-box/LRR-repeat protein n=1 Tax=Neochlamydia sp. S13 TaxID=1353976 RepID=UPI000FD16C1C|nr:leucine-rich repeat domain-containing protein [Neochlamydia sp. S13]BBI18121.1 Leucine-rich repeat LRR protein [Neochlamydia sp. S13]
MHPISSASIESLPNELLLPILEACAVPSLSCVCKRWHHLLATEVMPSLYKKIAQLRFPQGNTNTQQTLMLAKVYRLNPGLTSTEKVYQVFKQVFTLTKSISPLEFKEKTEEKKGLTLANYSSYLLNINRLLLWKKLPGGEEYLSREEIKHLPLEKKGELLRDWIEENCKNITNLDLYKAGMTYLPLEICQLSQLQGLDLSQNQLTSLPAVIGQLPQLQGLDLSQNQLTVLPTEIGKLSQLQNLYLKQNQLTALPAEIGQLPQLQGLYLNQNQLTALPAEIGQLSQLQGLYLNQNQLTSLPAEIGQLPQLQGLDLRENQIISLPAEIGQLSQLIMLELAENPLKDIAEKIRQRFQL